MREREHPEAERLERLQPAPERVLDEQLRDLALETPQELPLPLREAPQLLVAHTLWL